MSELPETPSGQGAPWSRTIGIGCFMAPIGFFSGGMIAAFVSKFVAYVTHAKGCDGVPSCNWLEYTVVGGVIGMITLPALIMWALRSPKRLES
jgi:hypothetical protein